jgi:glucose/arabinose dehydrogenase
LGLLVLVACNPAGGEAPLAATLVPTAVAAVPTSSPVPASPTASPAPVVGQVRPALGDAPAPAGSVGASALVVADADTANTALQPTTLQLPAGLALAPHTLRLPSGFAIEVVAAGLRAPRFMAFDQAGNLLVATTGDGGVYRYPAVDGTVQPAPTPPQPLAQLGSLSEPSNVAFYQATDGTYLYVGETTQVARYPYTPSGPLGPRQIVIPDLPESGHSTRTVTFGSDGMLYLGVGSSCNLCAETDPRRAAVSRYSPDGSNEERFATGMRNPVGLAFQPGSGLLWATVNERDNQGNEIPPDLVTVVRQGANYGWPGCQPPDARPQQGGEDCSDVTPPTVGIQAHSAPLGLAFLTGTQFPETYRGDLFVAQHGSWNRRPPAEPKLLQIDLDDSRPLGARDFATGWQDPSGSRWGRPAGVVVAPDGSLIVSDDLAGLLYRISYGG